MTTDYPHIPKPVDTITHISADMGGYSSGWNGEILSIRRRDHAIVCVGDAVGLGCEWVRYC